MRNECTRAYDIDVTDTVTVVSGNRLGVFCMLSSIYYGEIKRKSSCSGIKITIHMIFWLRITGYTSLEDGNFLV